MATYMLLLYAEDADEQTRARRWAELPEWRELTDELRERAGWIANAALPPRRSPARSWSPSRRWRSG